MGYAGFRKNLMLLMQAKDLTEAQLSREIAMAQPTMHKLMSGATTDPRISTLIPIAEYFNVTIDQLLGLVPFDVSLIASNKNSHSAIKVPVLPWEHLVEHRKNLADLTVSNWGEWLAINKHFAKDSYATRIKNSAFSAPFSNNTVIVVDPSLSITNGCYIFLKSTSTDSLTIKKCLFDGGDFWLMSLIDGIQPVLWNENSWLNFGIIVETYLSLHQESLAS